MSDALIDPRAARLGLMGKVFGLIAFSVILLWPPIHEMPPAAQRLAAVTALMAMLWLTQAIPVGVTSLIPLVLFPLLGIQSASVVSRAYIDRNVFLFLGGFIIALGIERWGLHRRMALHIVRVIGTGPRRLVLGFMLATAFLSMWISNTASTLLMMPIGMAMLNSYADQLGEGQDASWLRKLAVVLMLAIAYSASIGGMSTLVGTPTNVSFAGIWEEQFPDAPKMSAGQWMAAWVPVGAVMLSVTWIALTVRLRRPAGSRPLSSEFIRDRLRALGPPRPAERSMFVVFVLTALLWIFRRPLQFGSEPLMPGWESLIERFLLSLGTDAELAATAMHDSTVAIGMAVLMFCIPAERTREGQTRYLMDWKTAEGLPWEILLLIGGGFAVAGAFGTTGLSEWTGRALSTGISGLPIWLIVAVCCCLLTFLTEFTTNVATVNTLLPVLAGTALELGTDPRVIMIPATVSASCAFMLPIATPPNAIVFSSGKVRISDMVRHGFLLNLIGVVVISTATFWLLVPQLSLQLDRVPLWARAAAP